MDITSLVVNLGVGQSPMSTTTCDDAQSGDYSDRCARQLKAEEGNGWRRLSAWDGKRKVRNNLSGRDPTTTTCGACRGKVDLCSDTSIHGRRR
jgi:hypothetical protein